jgi:hypothetical protein
MLIHSLSLQSVLRQIHSLFQSEFSTECYLVSQYCSGDQTEKNENGGVCSIYGEEVKCIQGFGGET